MAIIAIVDSVSTNSVWYRVRDVATGAAKNYEFTPNVAHDTSELQDALLTGLIAFALASFAATVDEDDIVVIGPPVKLAALP